MVTGGIWISTSFSASDMSAHEQLLAETESTSSTPSLSTDGGKLLQPSLYEDGFRFESNCSTDSSPFSVGSSLYPSGLGRNDSDSSPPSSDNHECQEHELSAKYSQIGSVYDSDESFSRHSLIEALGGDAPGQPNNVSSHKKFFSLRTGEENYDAVDGKAPLQCEVQGLARRKLLKKSWRITQLSQALRGRSTSKVCNADSCEPWRDSCARLESLIASSDHSNAQSRKKEFYHSAQQPKLSRGVSVAVAVRSGSRAASTRGGSRLSSTASGSSSRSGSLISASPGTYSWSESAGPDTALVERKTLRVRRLVAMESADDIPVCLAPLLKSKQSRGMSGPLKDLALRNLCSYEIRPAEQTLLTTSPHQKG